MTSKQKVMIPKQIVMTLFDFIRIPLMFFNDVGMMLGRSWDVCGMMLG